MENLYNENDVATLCDKLNNYNEKKYWYCDKEIYNSKNSNKKCESINLLLQNISQYRIFIKLGYSYIKILKNGFLQNIIMNEDHIIGIPNGVSFYYGELMFVFGHRNKLNNKITKIKFNKEIYIANNLEEIYRGEYIILKGTVLTICSSNLKICLNVDITMNNYQEHNYIH